MSGPLVAPVRSSTTWHTGLGLVDDVSEICAGIHDNSWVDISLGGVGTTLDALSVAVDPLGALASWGVSWLIEHVRPLTEALDWLAGNADEVAAHAATWANVAAFTRTTAEQYTDRLRSEVSSWSGAAGDAYRGHAAEQTRVLEALSLAADGISYAVEGAGLLVGLVRGIVRDLIGDFVGTLAVRLPEWLAEAGLTLGLATPWVIAQVGTLVAKWVNRIQEFVRGLLRSLARLHPKLGELGEKLTGLSRYADDPGGSGSHPGGGSASHGPDPVSAGWHEGDPIPAPLTGGGVPTDATLGRLFHNETDPNEPWPFRAFRTPVHYMDEAERESNRLFVDAEGRLRTAKDGALFDTSHAMTLHSGGGRAIFVMDGNGNLYATLEHREGHIHHSSLLAGADVAGAGEIQVIDGHIVAMTDRSGHYRPEPATNDRALEAMRQQGLRTGEDFKQYDWDNQER